MKVTACPDAGPLWYPCRPAPNFGSVLRTWLHYQQRRAFQYGVLLAALGCAAEGPPGGGPQDLEGPIIMQVTPPNESIGVDTLADFEVLFDELVDPVSVPGSIEFLPSVPFQTRVRGRRVRILTDEPLLPDQAYVLTLHRGIRDYRNNSLEAARQLVFSTGMTIPEGRILGRLIRVGAGELVEVGLFRQTAGTFTRYQSLAAAESGAFEFNYLPAGTYRLAAVSGTLADFPDGMGLRSYALQTISTLKVDGDTTQLVMQMSAPLTEPQILSAEWVTPHYLILTFDRLFGEVRPPAGLLPLEDPLRFYLFKIVVVAIKVVGDHCSSRFCNTEM